MYMFFFICLAMYRILIQLFSKQYQNKKKKNLLNFCQIYIHVGLTISPSLNRGCFVSYSVLQISYEGDTFFVFLRYFFLQYGLFLENSFTKGQISHIR